MTLMRPMLMSSGTSPRDSEAWSFEVKWDGFRAVVAASPGGVTIWSRNGNDMTARYPELHGLGDGVKQRVVLDGEIVCLHSDGRPDFAALWSRSRGAKTPPVCFMAFDALQLGDELVVDRPYRERRRILDDLELAGPTGVRRRATSARARRCSRRRGRSGSRGSSSRLSVGLTVSRTTATSLAFALSEAGRTGWSEARAFLNMDRQAVT